MPVMINQKVLWFHIPRTAGVSMLAALQTMSRNCLWIAPLLRRSEPHVLPSEFDPDFLKKYKTAIFVRDEEERLRSHWNFMRFGTHPFYHGMEFEEFKSLPYFDRPMIDNFTDGHEFDFVGRFDHLQEDWKRFLEFCELPFIPLPHLNSSEEIERRSQVGKAKP